MTQCLEESNKFAEEIFGKDNPLTKGDMERFINRFDKRARRLQETDGTKTYGQALRDVAGKFSDQLEEEAKLRRKRAYLDVLSLNSRRDNLKVMGNDINAFRALIAGTNKFRYSADSFQAQMFKKLFGGKDGFWTELREENLVADYRDNSKEEDHANAMMGNDELVKDPTSLKVGKILRKGIDKARDVQNKFGAGIGDISNYITRTTHNPMKMLRLDSKIRLHLSKIAKIRLAGGNFKDIIEASFQRWKDFTLPLLDHKKTFNLIQDEKGKEDFMRDIYLSLISKVHDKIGDNAAEASGIDIQPSLAKSLGKEHRVLIYKKEASAWLKYNREYGQGTLNKALEAVFEGASKNYGLMKFLGPNVRGNYETLRQEIAEANKIPGTNFQLTRIDHVMQQLDGLTNGPVSYRMARIAANIRSLISMSKLGLVVPTSVTDVATQVSTLRYNGVGLYDAWFQSLGNLKNFFREDKKLKQVHDLIGTGVESMIGGVDRYRVSDAPLGTITDIQQMFFKLTGLKNWDHVHREGAVTIIAKHLAQNKDVEWENLDENLRNSLSQYTLTKDEWDVLRKNTFKADNGKEFITLDSGSNMSREQAAKILGKDASTIDEEDRAQASDELQDKVGMYFNDTANSVILPPSAADKAVITMGTRSGTVLGEALRFIGQFKVYSLSFTRRILGRELYGSVNGRSSTAALAELMVGTSILAYVAIATKAVLANETPPNPFTMTKGNLAKLAARTMTPGFGLWGQWIGGQYNQYGNDFIKSISGPALSTTSDLIDIMSELAQGKKVGKSTRELIRSNTPFHNIWFANGAMRYLYLHAVENRIDPGASLRARQRLLANGQDFIIQ